MFKILANLAKKLDKSGFKNAAISVDILIRIAAMDKLPIMMDPVIWSTEQIIEVLSTPKLLNEIKNNKEFFEKLLKEAKNRKINFDDIFEVSTDVFEYLDPDKMADDVDIAVNSTGLREDGTVENMNQGFVLEPFFSNYGNTQ